MYEIYAFFNARQIYDVLNAVVLIMGGGDFNGLLRTIGICGLIVASVYGIVKVRGEEPIGYVLAFAIIYGMLFVPKVQVTIIDPIRAQTYTVANVPIGLGFMASTTNKIGKWLTLAFDTNFSPVDSAQFSKHGMLFGATDVCLVPEFADYPAASDALVKSTDIWGDIASGSIVTLNPGRVVVMPGYAPMGCPSAGTTLNTRMTTFATNETTYIAKQIFPESFNAGGDFNNAVNDFNSSLLSSSQSAVTTLKQTVMLNMIRDGHIMNGRSNSNDFAVNLATASANQASRVSYASMAKIAEGALPKLRNVIDLTIISLFPIILVLAMLAGTKGGAVLKAYVMGMMWVQLWAPLYAVINYLMNFQLQTTLLPKTQGQGVAGFNLLNVMPIQTGAISEQAIAGMLTISIPMIAYAVIKGGEVAMSSVASSLMSPAVGAASSQGAAAGLGNSQAGNTQWSNMAMNNNTWGNNTGNNRSTGNTQEDNYSGGNYTANNSMGNKHDLAYAEMSSAASTISTNEGSMKFEGGRLVGASLSGFDMGGVSFGTTTSMGRTATQASGENAATSQAQSAGFVASNSSSFSQGVGASSSYGTGTGVTNTWGGGNNWNSANNYSRSSDASRSGEGSTNVSNAESMRVGSNIGVGGSAQNYSGSESSSSQVWQTPGNSGGASGSPGGAAGGSPGASTPAQVDRNTKTAGTRKSMDGKGGIGLDVSTSQQQIDSGTTRTAGGQTESSSRAVSDSKSARRDNAVSETENQGSQGQSNLGANYTSNMQATRSGNVSATSGTTASSQVADSKGNQATLSVNQARDIWESRLAANGGDAKATIADMAANSKTYAQQALNQTMGGDFKSSNGVGSGPNSVSGEKARGAGQVSAANAANNAAVAENYSANAGVVASQMPSSDGMSEKVGTMKSGVAGQLSDGAGQVSKLGGMSRMESSANIIGSMAYQQMDKGMGTLIANTFFGGSGSSAPTDMGATVSRVAAYNPQVAAIVKSHSNGNQITPAQLKVVTDAIKNDYTK